VLVRCIAGIWIQGEFGYRMLILAHSRAWWWAGSWMLGNGTEALTELDTLLESTNFWLILNFLAFNAARG
jgi:hypothetical protein